METKKHNSCTQIQEEIAWGHALSENAQRHVLDCEKCRNLALEFEKLDTAIENQLDVMVPEDFAERVMTKIQEQSPEPLNGKISVDWFNRLATQVGHWLEYKPVQVGVASFGFLFTMGNLVRFVFSILVSGTA